MSRESTTRACLTLKSRQLQALQDLSRESGAPVAELTRRAVDAYLAARVPGYVPGPGHQASALDHPGPTPVTTHS
jgi:hypothetical protein